MKKLMLKFIITLLGFLHVSFIHPTHISEAGKAVNYLISEVEQKLTKKYHMRAIGITIGMPGGIVKKLGISFQLQGPLSKEELRKLLISTAQDFVDDVNANQEIQPFLEKRPFEINNIQIVLYLIDANGYGLKYPHIGIANFRQGKLDYTTSVTVNNMPKDVTEEWETYEEAVKILQKQSNQEKHEDMSKILQKD